MGARAPSVDRRLIRTRVDETSSTLTRLAHGSRPRIETAIPAQVDWPWRCKSALSTSLRPYDLPVASLQARRGRPETLGLKISYLSDSSKQSASHPWTARRNSISSLVGRWGPLNLPERKLRSISPVLDGLLLVDTVSSHFCTASPEVAEPGRFGITILRMFRVVGSIATIRWCSFSTTQTSPL